MGRAGNNQIVWFYRPANHLGYLNISLYSVDQSGDCVVVPENAQGEETINFSYEIIVLDIYFSPNSLSK